jgi:hypothetical protein
MPVENKEGNWYKPAPQGKTDAWLNDLFNKDAFVANILNNPNEYNAQVIYTKIDRDATNKPTFTNYTLNADPNFYFYPASMVKMPIAFLALHKINELKAKGINVDKYYTMLTKSATAAQTEVYNDPTSVNGSPSVAQYIKKIFLVSDNDASNRLYEFLGQEYINSTLQRMGYKNMEILHRLSTSMPIDEHRITNPIEFRDSNGKVVYEQAVQKNTKKYSKRNDLRGVGYMSEGKKVDKAFDFSAKNRFSLNDMHSILQAVLFPNEVEEKRRFNFTEEDRNFLMTYMSMLPKESKYPSYEPVEHFDAYVKFNLFGSEKTPIPNKFRIFNKVGFAYGYITDASYIVDFENNIEFILSSTIYVNKDGIFNDDKYETDAIALPFMKKIGEAIYNYEKSRKRNPTDLSGFKLDYNLQ